MAKPSSESYSQLVTIGHQLILIVERNGGNEMSRKYNVKKVRSAESSTTVSSNSGNNISHPQNCRTECPYGYGRSFCFPCMAKIMSEHAAQKRE